MLRFVLGALFAIGVGAGLASCGEEAEDAREGQALSGCPGNLIRCGDRCVDLQNDALHCGACGFTCPKRSACSFGSCSAEAATTLQCRPGEFPCAGRCVDPWTDPLHCGSCGFVCPAGTRCAFGLCSPVLTPAMGRDFDVPPSAPGAWTRCEQGFWSDLWTDVLNCGSCNRACQGGEACVRGECRRPCSGEATDCGGSCADLLVDEANCGACGRQCPAGSVCISGTCL